MSSAQPPRVLIEDWRPAAAIGVECMRERSTGQQPPDKRLHIWWARRPLCASRAAVLGSVLPADFPHEVFERLLGFWGSSQQIIAGQRIVDNARARGGTRIQNPHGERAFKHKINSRDIERAHEHAKKIWGSELVIIDPMAGGGSIPLESCRLGFRTLANEYNPVACSVIEATVSYPFNYGITIANRARFWADEIRHRLNNRISPFFPEVNYNGQNIFPMCYIFARTVPCPDTHFQTPLVPNWNLLKPKDSPIHVWGEPIVDINKGTWSVKIIDNRVERRTPEVPQPTYRDGKGISLFNKTTQITPDYIKAKAQAGEMGLSLYAIAIKTRRGVEFISPSQQDYDALINAEKSLKILLPEWRNRNIIPIENRYKGECDRSYVYGFTKWSDLFTPRQLLTIGYFVEELNTLRQEILEREGQENGNAIIHLLALIIDKLADYNSNLAFWHSQRGIIAHTFEKHDFSFKTTIAEMAFPSDASGLLWPIESVLKAYEDLSKIIGNQKETILQLTQGSATNLSFIENKSITAVVVDPPYADNVQYAELADFFYVWLKRTIGYQHPELFSTYLCDHSEEAVVNVSRFKQEGLSEKEAKRQLKEAKQKANEFYQDLMTNSFKEARRILRDDGVLTVMFTHKKQEAWETLFNSLIKAGFTITATWPIKTESEHSLHQAKKNAAQSTVILVARKRAEDADVGWYDPDMRSAIRTVAQKTAERLRNEGLNPVDQLVGSFGPAIEVFSRHSEVKTDMGDPVGVDKALDEASRAVTDLRIQQLAKRGLDGVEPEGKFYLLCWDVLQAAEFRFNEAKLLGHAVGMDVDTLVAAGLVSKTGDKIKLLSAADRRRPKKLEMEEVGEALFGALPTGKKKRVKKGDVLKVHPNDPHFRTALDGCHALALRYIEAGGSAAGIGAARQLAVQQGWKNGSPIGKLMEALVTAAPPALWFEKGKTSTAALYPEFRAWHDLLLPLFGIESPVWKEEGEQSQLEIFGLADEAEDSEDSEAEEEETVEGSE